MILGSLFGKKELVSIDPGTINVKIVSGTKEKNNVRINNFGLASFNVEKVDSSHIFEENLYYLINTSLTSLKIKSKNFIFTIPINFSFFTNFTLPRINEKNLPTAIKFEAQRFLPIDVNESVYGYRYFLQEIAGEESRYLVFFLSTPKSYIQKIEKVVKMLSGKLLKIDSEVWALEKYFLNSLENFVLVDVGHNNSLIIGYVYGKTLFAKKVIIGGNILVSNLSQTLKVNKQRTIMHLQERGFYFPPEESDLKNISEIFIKNLCEEVKRNISDFENIAVGKISKIYWTGGLATYKGFLEKVTQNIPEYLNSLLNPADLLGGDKFSQLKEKSNFFSVAAGALI